MKRLTLFRHAKTERVADSGRDFDRRLTDRGQADATRIGDEIRKLELDFELVIASPAARAAETAHLAGLEVRFDQQIYDATTGDLQALIENADDEVTSLMLIGHNPGFERLASRLTGQSLEMPTGSLVEIEFPVDHWRDVRSGTGRLNRFLEPKELD